MESILSTTMEMFGIRTETAKINVLKKILDTPISKVLPENLRSSITTELVSSSPLSLVNSAYFVFLYHAIATQNQQLHANVADILKSTYGRNKFDIPTSAIESLAFLKIYLRDFLLGGTSEEKELLAFTLGSQGCGKTSLSLSWKNEEGTLSQNVVDEHTGENLEKTKVLRLDNNIQFKRTESVGLDIEDKENIRLVKLNYDAKSESNGKVHVHLMDLGGHYEYGFVSTFFYSSKSLFTIVFDGSSYQHSHYYSRVGVYVDNILHRCKYATLQFVANKADKGKPTIFDEEREVEVFLATVEEHVLDRAEKRDLHPTIIRDLQKVSMKDNLGVTKMCSANKTILENETIFPIRKSTPALWHQYANKMEEVATDGFVEMKQALQIYDDLIEEVNETSLEKGAGTSLGVEDYEMLRNLLDKIEAFKTTSGSKDTDFNKGDTTSINSETSNINLDGELEPSHQKDLVEEGENSGKFLHLHSDGPAGKKYHYLMGIYKLTDEQYNNHPIYKLVDGKGLLYVSNYGNWSVYNRLHPTMASLRNPQNTTSRHPPATGWEYADNGWKVDPSLTVTPLDDETATRHVHCLTCIAGASCEYRGCETASCRSHCGAIYHGCKEEEHQLLCPLKLQPCVNREFGCGEMVVMKEMVKHFKQCEKYEIVDVDESRGNVPFIKELKESLSILPAAPLYFKVQSSGGAGAKYPGYMGVYKIDESRSTVFNVYKRMGSQHFIYVSINGRWRISDVYDPHKGDPAMGHWQNNPTPSFPPSEGWTYRDDTKMVGSIWTKDPTLRVEKMEIVRLEKTDKDYEAALHHLKSTGAIINFPVNDLSDYIFFPRILVNSFKALFRHDLREQVMYKLPRPTAREEDIEHNYENEAQKIFESGLISNSIYERLYQYLRVEKTIPLDKLIELIERLGIGLKTEDGGLLIPSLADNSMSLFQDWYDSRYEGQDLSESLLQVEFSFDRGAFTIGVSESLIVALQKAGLIRFLKAFREKVEDRKAGTVYLGFGVVPNYEGTDIFIREEERFENRRIFRKRSVSIILKTNINEESCELFLKMIDETKIALRRIQEFSNFPEDVIYSVRLPCSKCIKRNNVNGIIGQADHSDIKIGYFDWTKVAKSGTCLPQAIHDFEASHKVLSKYMSRSAEIDARPRRTKQMLPSTEITQNIHKNIVQDLIDCREDRHLTLNIENVTVQGALHLTTQNLTIQWDKLGIRTEEDKRVFKKLIGPEGDEADTNQKATRLADNEVDFKLLEISTITRSTSLLHYSGSHGGPWHGTAFLSTIDNFSGAALFSSGHNFEDKGVLLKDYDKFNFYFQNIDGHQSASFDNIPLNLQDLLNDHNCTLVIAYKGMQIIHHKNSPPREENLSGDGTKLDYFALIFHDSDIQDKFKQKGLRFLPLASPPQLAPKLGHPVLIMGHPAVNKCKCVPATCSCTHPLRLSYGKESISSKMRLKYDLDTLSGNSGSAVTGKYYTVKGIHRGSSNDNKNNKAQTMKTVLENLERHSLLQTATP